MTDPDVTVETPVPTIPDIRPDNIQQALDAIAEILKVREGVAGDPLDQAITWRDLYGTGALPISGYNDQAYANIPGLGTTYLPVVEDYVPSYTQPPAPTNVAASGALANVIVSWDAPSYANHAYTEIWRAGVDNIGMAVKIGTAQGLATIYADDLGQTGLTRYYWIRFVSQQNVPGPYNATAGTSATTGLVLTGDITDASITTAKLGDSSVTTAKMGAASVTSTILATGSVTEAKIGTAAVTTTKIGDLSITQVKMASGLFVPEIVSALPALPDANYPQGALVTLTTDNKLYRSTGTAWTAAVATVDLSGTVSTAQLADGAVTAAKTALSAINATSGALNSSTVNTAQLITGAVTGAIIAASTITGSNVAASTLTGSNIASATVTGTNIAASTITAGNIAAGTITATQIAASTITSDKLVLIGGGACINVDPLLRDSTVWINAGAGSFSLVTVSDAPAGSTVLRSGTGLSSYVEDGTYYPIDTSKTYRVRFWARNVGGNGILYMDLRQYQGVGTPCAVNGGRSPYQPAGVNPGSTWTEYSYQWDAADWQSGVKFVRMDWLLNYGGTAGYYEMCYPRFEEMRPGELIVDGAIITSKIAALAVTAATIATATITSTQIASATIIGGNIAGSTITGSNIAAGTITASNIAADTLTASQIAAGAIGASELAAGSVVAGKIATSAIVAGDGVIATAAIATAQIQDAAITNAKIGSLAVDAAKIANATISGAKIASATITGANIASATITYANIASVNADTITVGNLRGINIGASSFMTKGTYCTSAVGAGAGTINVKDTTDFPTAGSGYFIDTANDHDGFSWTGKNATQLTGCTGVLAHNSGAIVMPFVKAVLMAGNVNEFRVYGSPDGGASYYPLAIIGADSGGTVGAFGSTLLTGTAVSGTSNSGIGGVFSSTSNYAATFTSSGYIPAQFSGNATWGNALVASVGASNPTNVTSGLLANVNGTLKFANGSYWNELGKVVQVQEAEYATYTAITASIPRDNTIPQSSEGTLIVSVSITPKSSSNVLYVEAGGQVYPGSTCTVITTICVSASTNALNTREQGAAAGYSLSLSNQAKMSAGTTATLTFSARIGSDIGASLGVNGATSALYGGRCAWTIRVTELTP